MADPNPESNLPPFVREIPASAAPEYRGFWRLWQEEDFFACHEVLEELWRRTADAQRGFYHGLIHAAVTRYQHRRGNAVGAARQWVKTQERLAPFRPVFYGVNIEQLLRATEEEIAPSLRSLSEEQAGRVEALRREMRRKVSGSQGA
jgi:predicted metal-dependent hydrolase